MANTELGIPRLLDAEGLNGLIIFCGKCLKVRLKFNRIIPFTDVDSSRPDEKSILTYVASYYHTFARMKNEMKSGRRIANVNKFTFSFLLTFKAAFKWPHFFLFLDCWTDDGC